MVQSPEERGAALGRSMSQSEGDPQQASDGMDANAEVQLRAVLRYQKLLKTDTQLQVLARARHLPHCSSHAQGSPVRIEQYKVMATGYMSLMGLLCIPACMHIRPATLVMRCDILCFVNLPSN